MRVKEGMPLLERGFEKSSVIMHILREDFPVAAPGELPADLYPATKLRDFNPAYNQLTRVEVRQQAGARLVEAPDGLRDQLEPFVRQLHWSRWRSHRDYGTVAKHPSRS